MSPAVWGLKRRNSANFSEIISLETLGNALPRLTEDCVILNISKNQAMGMVSHWDSNVYDDPYQSPHVHFPILQIFYI